MSKRERFKHSSSVFVVIRKEGQILWLRRSQTGWLDGCYSIPAGAIDGGEPAQHAAAREAREETCLDIQACNLELRHVIHCMTDGDEWMGHFFEANKWTGNPRLGEPHKHDDLCWVRLDQTSFPVVPYVMQALQCIKQGQTFSRYGWKC